LKIIAHRGYSGIAPENTLAAFRKALDVGCNAVELDVQISADGVPFVIHDPTLDRTTSGSGRVVDRTARELAVLSAGYRARFAAEYAEERIPALEDALAFLRGRAEVLVEIKGESVFESREGIERSVGELLARFGMLEAARVISFQALALLRVKRLQPGIRTGFLVEHDELGRGLDRAVDIGASMILYHRSQINRMKVDMAHDRGLECTTFTIDSPDELPEYAGMGVEAILSNFPDRLLDRLRTTPNGRPV